MDRLSAELLTPYRLDDLYRDADRERLRASLVARPHRRPLLLPIAGRLLIRAGRWLECAGQPCPAAAPAPQA